MASVPERIGYTSTSTGGGPAQGLTVVLDPLSPTGGSPVKADDWMVAAVTVNGGYVATDIITPPEGWVRLYPGVPTVAGTMEVYFFARRREVGDGTYTFTCANPRYLNASMFWVRGADDVSKWIFGQMRYRIDEITQEKTLLKVAGVATTRPSSLVLTVGLERTLVDETDITSLSSASKWFFVPQVGTENRTLTTTVVGYKEVPTPTTTPVETITYPNTQSLNALGFQVAIPPNSSLLKIQTDTGLKDAAFKVVSASGALVDPGSLKAVKPGYDSVTQMLQQDFMYIAHRGGSRDFPEMSLYAYGQSALLGYPALEISVACTSDGVYFGLHDQTLDRTSGITGAMASDMTWAEVQGYNILGSMAANNPTQPSRPYMRWEELFDMYYQSHVIVVDSKYLNPATTLSTLLDRIGTLPDSTERVIGKFFGVSGNAMNTSGPAYEFSRRGYKCWGYFYENDDVASYQGRWDILGLPYNASQAAWDSITSYGKKVVAHICPDQAAVTMAISKGAKGAMVAGVKEVPAVVDRS